MAEFINPLAAIGRSNQTNLDQESEALSKLRRNLATVRSTGEQSRLTADVTGRLQQANTLLGRGININDPSAMEKLEQGRRLKGDIDLSTMIGSLAPSGTLPIRGQEGPLRELLRTMKLRTTEPPAITAGTAANPSMVGTKRSSKFTSGRIGPSGLPGVGVTFEERTTKTKFNSPEAQKRAREDILNQFPEADASSITFDKEKGVVRVRVSGRNYIIPEEDFVDVE